MIFDISVTTVYCYAEYMAELVNSELKGELNWPDSEERKLLYNLIPVYERCIGILDGTHCRIQVPRDTDEENLYFSGYKNYHTQNYLLVVDMNGFILYLDGPYPGHENDTSCANQSELFTESQSYLSSGEKILADGIFRGFNHLIIPYRSDEMNANTVSDLERERMKQFNDVLQNLRARVEHGIHRVKAIAVSLTQRYRRDKKTQKAAVQSAVVLHNWTRRKRAEKQI
jgi:hypothetical protein